MLEFASETMTSRRDTASRGVFAWTVVTNRRGRYSSPVTCQALLRRGLADDDAVRPHTQAVYQQFALPHRAGSFQIRRARFESSHVRLLELQFGRVFDGDDALLGEINAESAFRSVVLPAPCRPQ